MATHTLEMLRTLETAGFERKQAEAVADIVATHTDSYSKKDDIVRLEGKVDSDITRLEDKIKADSAQLEGRIEAAISRLEGSISDLRAEIADLRTEIANFRAEIRTELAAMNGKIDTMQAIVKLLAGMMVGLYIGLALLLVDRLL